MSKQKLLLVTDGDSADPRTWSNIPYFFLKYSREYYEINSLNVRWHRHAIWLYDKVISRCYAVINKCMCNAKGTHSYSRSRLYVFLSNRKIKKALKAERYDFIMLTGFGYSTGKISYDAKVIYFCDDTYERYIRRFYNRRPLFGEKYMCALEYKNIEHSSHVFAFFPDLAEHLKLHIGDRRKVQYLGPVVNADPESLFEDVNTKREKRRIIFVGRKMYRAAGQLLYESIRFINEKNSKKVYMDVIGYKFTQDNIDIKNHGYLNKSIQEEANRYYSLMRGASLYVNAHSAWGAFSSSLEAMYYFTPIIIAPYDEFVSTFGRDIPFGSYLLDANIDSLSRLIEEYLDNDELYIRAANSAHKCVNCFTWDRYTETFKNCICDT
jgi:glycosyltransferase involved in cell wall biosynthesis